MAEAFVKTFKRDYVRIIPISNAAAALAGIDHWMEDYNTVHPHSRLGYRSPREYILSQLAACPVYGVNSSWPALRYFDRMVPWTFISISASSNTMNAVLLPSSIATFRQLPQIGDCFVCL